MHRFLCISLHVLWTASLRGRRSRNKVSVGEPMEGSIRFVNSPWMLSVQGRPEFDILDRRMQMSSDAVRHLSTKVWCRQTIVYKSMMPLDFCLQKSYASVNCRLLSKGHCRRSTCVFFRCRAQVVRLTRHVAGLTVRVYVQISRSVYRTWFQSQNSDQSDICLQKSRSVYSSRYQFTNSEVAVICLRHHVPNTLCTWDSPDHLCWIVSVTNEGLCG